MTKVTIGSKITTNKEKLITPARGIVMSINIDDLTIGQIKEINALSGTQNQQVNSLNGMIGKKVIIRTYSAGVWFGELSEKSGNEVFLKEAREYIAQSDLPDEVISDCLSVIDDNKSEFEPNQCAMCEGSGEALWTDSVCVICNGTGEEKEKEKEKEKEYRNDYGDIDPIFNQLIKPYSPTKEAA